MGTAFAVSLGLAVAVLAFKGTDPKGLVSALRLTARWSFLLFWLAYSGSAIATLFAPAFASLSARGRDFGLSYASAMTVHFCLVVWLFQISAQAPLAGPIFDLFVIGAFFTYLLALLSFGRLIEALGSTLWRVLRVVGMNYILFAFAWDLVLPVFRAVSAHDVSTGLVVQYLPFAAMCLAAPLLVLAATARSRLQVRYRGVRLKTVVD